MNSVTTIGKKIALLSQLSPRSLLPSTEPPHPTCYTFTKATMSRSAADATRFTATFPHAYSKPHPNRKGPPPPSSQSPPWRSSPSNTPSPNPLDLRNPFSLTSSSSSSSSSNRFPSSPSDSAPTPLDETPRQKVARLRAARAAARAADIPLWDRVVLTGRNVADRAHRITALGLIGLTGMFRFGSLWRGFFFLLLWG